jgi:hypothetical protein
MRWKRPNNIWQRKYTFFTKHCFNCGISFRREYYWRRRWLVYAWCSDYSNWSYCEPCARDQRKNDSTVCAINTGRS